MKRCPKCDFSFVNFHHVCDFDGTELVDDPETLPVSTAVSALAAASRSRFLRLIKSPVFFTVLGLAGVLSSLLLIVYYDAARQPDSITESQAARLARECPDSIASLARPTQASDQIKTPAISTSRNVASNGSDRATSHSEIRKPSRDGMRERSATASVSRPRFRSSPAVRNQQREIALQRQLRDKALQKESKESALHKQAKENAIRKESKLSAALKTTWNVLKKPFRF